MINNNTESTQELPSVCVLVLDPDVNFQGSVWRDDRCGFTLMMIVCNSHGGE